jgi:hypothetical protein
MRMRILRIFMAIFLLSFMAGCDDSDSDDTSSGAETLRVNLSAEGASGGESLVLTAGTESALAITVTDAAGNPMPDASVIFVEEGGLLSFDGGFTDSGGGLLTAVSTDVFSAAERHGVIRITAANGADVGTLTLPYKIAAWDRVLYGGELTIYASNMRDTFPRTREFEAPKGLTFESVSPNLTKGVRVDIYEGKLRTVTSSQAANGVKKVEVKVAGIANPIELDINVHVGNGTPGNPYPIGTAEEFFLISEYSISPTYFILDDDIDLAGVVLPGMPAFSGGLDGDNHTLYNLKQTIFGPKGGATANPANLQNDFRDITVKNLNIVIADGGVFSTADSITANTSTAFIGVIAYMVNNLTAENVHISGNLLAGVVSPARVGFLAGQVYNILNASDVTIDGNLNAYLNGTTSTSSVGFLAGSAAYGNIENVSVNGVMNASFLPTINSSTPSIGGLLGYIGLSAVNTLYGVNIKNSAVNADINVSGKFGTFYIGGVVGVINGYGNTVDGCYFNGNIEEISNANNFSAIGGIAGKVNNTNTAPLGQLYTNWIKNSYSAGSLIASTGLYSSRIYIGGIMGSKDDLTTLTNSIMNITNTYSTVYISSPVTGGGIIGGRPDYDIVTVNNVALNPSVNGDSARARIGSALTASSGGNYAHEALKLYSAQGITPETPIEGSPEDGDYVSAGFLTPEFFTGLGFSTDLWDLDFSARDYKYPLLKNAPGQENVQMPEYF